MLSRARGGQTDHIGVLGDSAQQLHLTRHQVMGAHIGADAVPVDTQRTVPHTRV